MAALGPREWRYVRWLLEPAWLAKLETFTIWLFAEKNVPAPARTQAQGPHCSESECCLCITNAVLRARFN